MIKWVVELSVSLPFQYRHLEVTCGVAGQSYLLRAPFDKFTLRGREAGVSHTLVNLLSLWGGK